MLKKQYNKYSTTVMVLLFMSFMAAMPIHAQDRSSVPSDNTTSPMVHGDGILSEDSMTATNGTETVSSADTFDELEGMEGLDEWTEEDDAAKEVYDPIEPVNRFFFQVNDKLYFWGIKPVAEGYAWLLPKVIRESIANFFSNVFTPIRTANCLLQFNFRGVGTEVSRFAINTTVGLLGFMDPAYDKWEIARVNEDFGQTLGVYGVGFGPYIVIPFIGPSCPRDAAGMFVDSYFNPVNYYLTSFVSQAAIRGSWTVNERSLQLGEYESLKKSSLDPYVALRSAYYQFRENMVNDQPKNFR